MCCHSHCVCIAKGVEPAQPGPDELGSLDYHGPNLQAPPPGTLSRIADVIKGDLRELDGEVCFTRFRTRQTQLFQSDMLSELDMFGTGNNVAVADPSNDGGVDDCDSRLRAFTNQHVAPNVGSMIATPEAIQQYARTHSGTAPVQRLLRSAFSGTRNCGNADVGHSDWANAIDLTWVSFEGAQGDGINCKIEEIQRHNHQWASFFIGFDESFVMTTLSPAHHRLYKEALLQELKVETVLDQCDIDTICEQSTAHKAGGVHMLVQNCAMLLKGFKSEIICPAKWVQNTKAATLLKAIGPEHEALKLQHIHKLLQFFVGLCMLFFSGDHASSNMKLERIVNYIFADNDNAIVLFGWCFAHSIGIIACDTLKASNVMSMMYCLSRLLTQYHYRELWWSNYIMVMSSRVRILRVHAVLQPMKRASDEYWDFVCEVTLLKRFATRSRSFFDHLLTDKDKAQKLQLLECVSNLKETLTVDVKRGIFDVYHICFGREILQSGHTCDGVHDSSCIACIICVSNPIMTIITTATGSIAMNRLSSVSPLLSLLTFSVMCAALGPYSWLRAWPTKYCDMLMKANDRDKDKDPDGTKRENSARLGKVSRFWSDKRNWVMICLVCVCTMPLDKLLLYLEAEDEKIRKGKDKDGNPCIPLI